MLARIRGAELSPLFAALYLVATLIIGVAHVPAGAAARIAADPSLAAFVLPDGTIADLCLDRHGGSHQQSPAKACDACRLAAAPGLPEPASPELVPAQRWQRIAFIVIDEAPRSTARPTSHSARGPPRTA